MNNDEQHINHSSTLLIVITFLFHYKYKLMTLMLCVFWENFQLENKEMKLKGYKKKLVGLRSTFLGCNNA